MLSLHPYLAKKIGFFSLLNRIFMKNIIGILLICMMSAFEIQAQTVSPHHVDGLLYMKLADDYPLSFKVNINNGRTIELSEFPFLQDIFNKYGVSGIAQNFYLFDDSKLLRTLTIEFSEIHQADSLIAELSQLKQIEYAEKPVIKQPLTTPNDPYYGTINSYNMKWYLDMLNASYTWDIQVGSPTVKVAVVDNAIWGSHEDLQIASSNLCYFTGSYTITPHTGSANPPTSVNQNITCTESSFYSNCPAYDWSHGTHCAGLVGAKNNNGKGIASLGSGVTLMGVRMTNDNQDMIYYNNAVQWAAQNGAKVISMSYGSPYSEHTEQQVLQTAYNRGIILVAAAGNEAEESGYEGIDPNFISYPAGYSSVISVASVNYNKKLSDFSQYGPGRADIAAPGGYFVSGGYETLPNILSTTFCKTQFLRLSGINLSNVYYDGMQGTSMACPIAAGLCGLLASAYPSITPAQAKTCIQSTASPLASGSRPIDGNGIINPYSAVLCAQELAGNVGINNPLPFENHILVFPNPTKDIVEVICDTEEMNAIEIFDIAGRIVYADHNPLQETSISVSNLPPAVYVIKVSFNKGNSQYSKFIKQ